MQRSRKIWFSAAALVLLVLGWQIIRLRLWDVFHAGLAFQSWVSTYPTHFHAKIVDETGVPVANATVTLEASYLTLASFVKTKQSRLTQMIEVTTDSTGHFDAQFVAYYFVVREITRGSEFYSYKESLQMLPSPTPRGDWLSRDFGEYGPTKPAVIIVVRRRTGGLP